MKKFKWPVIVLVLLALIGGGYWFFKPKKIAKPVETQTYTVGRGNILISVSAAGTIGPKREVEVKSKASGAILKMYVRDGDWVTKGQLLVALDKTDEATKVRQAELDLVSAQAKLSQSTVRRDEANRRYEQTLALREGAYISQDELLKAASELKLAESDLSIAKASRLNTHELLNNAKLRYADTEIRSPITGLVLAKWVEEGQLISSGISATSGGTPLMTIGDMSVIMSRAEIDEVDIGKVQVGQPATVQVDAYGERQFEGTLTHISPKGTDKSNVTVFGIEIGIQDPKKNMLKAGMTNTAKIIVIKQENSLIAPTVAIHRDHPESDQNVPQKKEKNSSEKPGTLRQKPRYYVWLKTGNTRTKKIVVTGATDYQNTEIISGLKAGDVIESPNPSTGKASRGSNGGQGQDRNTMRAMRSLGGH